MGYEVDLSVVVFMSGRQFSRTDKSQKLIGQ
jgi:hypothetical protein